MTLSREKITGIVGTITFGILLLLILIFSRFTLPAPSQGLEGIPVMFGNMEDAGGNEEAAMNPTELIEPSAQPTPNTQIDKNVITQNTQPSLSVKPTEKKTNTTNTSKTATKTTENKREREAERIREQMSGLFGKNNSGSRGTTEGAGTQGVSTGNSKTGAKKGVGGIGSYDLGGRSVGSGGLAQPLYTVNDYGTVVVNITVDPNGNVIQAGIGRGTNTPSPALRNEALRAARSTKFNAISSSNNQKGTITYRFNLN